MSIVSSLQKIRTYNQDIRRLQGAEEPDNKTPVKKRPSITLNRSKGKPAVKKNRHEVFVNPRVEPIKGTPKLLTAVESNASPIETNDITVNKKQANEPRIKFNETKPEAKNVAKSATQKAENPKPTISIPHENQEAIKSAKAKLQSRKKEAQANISKHIQSVSNHPESIQTSGRRDVFEVGEEDTKSATIVRDKKIKKHSILSDIVSGISRWFLRIKNTYITPPKPTYTVDQSERKAGVVQDATSQTGTALTDYESFAQRLREKYKDKYTDTKTDAGEASTYETEPSWLPALPEYKQKISGIKDIAVTPEKRAGGESDIDTPSEFPEDTSFATKSTTEITPQISVPNNQTKEELTGIVNQSPEEPDEPPTYTDPNTQETYNLPKEAPPSVTSQLPKQPTEKTEPDTDNEIPATEAAPETTPEITADLSQPTNTTDQTEESVAPKTEVANEEPRTAEETAETQPRQESIARRARDLVYETAQSLLSKNTSEKEPAIEEDTSDSGVIPSSYHSLSETKQAELRINKLSLVVVGGVLLLVILVTLALAFFRTGETSGGGVTTANNSYLSNTPAQTFRLGQYDTGTERIQMLKEHLQNTSATLVQISPVKEDTNDLLSTKETIELLDINTPSPLFNVSEEMHFISDPNGNLILLFTINDRSQALGVMLQWEDSLTEDLSPLLYYVDTSGSFTDQTIAEIDIRSQIRGDDSHVISYAVTNDFILITNSLSGLETILKALD